MEIPKKIHNWTGKKHTPETRAKMRASALKYTKTPEHCRNISIGRKGIQSRLGAVLSDETKRKISIAHKGIRIGHKHPDAVKEKIRLSNLGKNLGKKYIRSQEYCQKISLRLKGKERSSEHGKAISLAKKGVLRVERVLRICPNEYCRATFLVRPRAEKMFCSIRCAAVYRRMKNNVSTHDTDIERIFEAGLKALNIPYQKQVPVGGISIADFLLPNNVAIYCDGDYWHNLPKAIPRDKWITKNLTEKGYRVFRFWGKDIKANINDCLKQLPC